MKLGCVLAMGLGLACVATTGCGSSGVGEYPGVAGGGPAKAVPTHDAGSSHSGGSSSSGGSSGSGSSSGGSEDAGDGATPFGSVDVASFTLIDATTGAPVPGFNPIQYGATIDLGLVGPQLSMLVTPPPVAAVGSMAFALDASFTYTADTAPYSLCGKDAKGDYNPCPLGVGPHTLTVTTYPQAELGGDPYQPPTVFEFKVIDSASDAGTD